MHNKSTKTIGKYYFVPSNFLDFHRAIAFFEVKHRDVFKGRIIELET